MRATYNGIEVCLLLSPNSQSCSWGSTCQSLEPWDSKLHSWIVAMLLQESVYLSFFLLLKKTISQTLNDGVFKLADGLVNCEGSLRNT